MPNNINKEILFRARRKDTGEWVSGNYVHYQRKGEFHVIKAPDNVEHQVYRDSLQIRLAWITNQEHESEDNWWEDV